MPTADLAGDRIVVHTSYADRDAIRQVPGARYDKESRTWSAPLSWTTAKTLRGVFRDRLEITEALAEWGWREWETRVEPSLRLRELAMDPQQDTDGWETRDGLSFSWESLYPFQRTAVQFLTTARRALLGDEMGTGKTIQTIAALEAADAYPALIVAPASVKRGWAREFSKWAPHRKVLVLSGSAAKRRKALAEDFDVLVMNYDLLRYHSKLAGYGSVALRRCVECGGEDPDVKVTSCEAHPKELNALSFVAVVADEAHRIKDPKAKQTRALKAAAGKADVRFALTGTPIGNRPDELWSILNFLSPEEWASKTRFVERYCSVAWNGFGNEVLGLRADTREEFYETIDPRFLRRPTNLVLPHLPPVTWESMYVPMTPQQAKAYRQMEEKAIAAIEGGTVSGISPLSQLTRLTQFASAFAVELDGEIRLQAPSNKVDALLEIIGDTDEQLVVFAQSRQLIDLAAEALRKESIQYGRITGAESEAQRDEALQAFRRGDLRVMLLTLGAGGTGIDGLQVARIAVFLERGWSLLERKQAIGRLRRQGQVAGDVLVLDVVSEGTIEEEQIDRLSVKEERLEEIVRDASALLAVLKGPRTKENILE